jgi:hypothetical protein
MNVAKKTVKRKEDKNENYSFSRGPVDSRIISSREKTHGILILSLLIIFLLEYYLG